MVWVPKKTWNIFEKKYITWYQKVPKLNLLKQTERFLTSWCILRSPSLSLWISIKFCIYWYVRLIFLWNPIFDQSRTVSGYSCHFQFNVVDKRSWSSKWQQLLFACKPCTYRLSNQTKYTQRCKLNLTEYKFPLGVSWFRVGPGFLCQLLFSSLHINTIYCLAIVGPCTWSDKLWVL